MVFKAALASRSSTGRRPGSTTPGDPDGVLEILALCLKDPEFLGGQVIVREEAVWPTRLLLDRAATGFHDQAISALALFSGDAVQTLEKGLGKVNAGVRHGCFLTDHVIPIG